MREKDWLPDEAQHGKRERAMGQERRCVRMALRRSEQVFPSTSRERPGVVVPPFHVLQSCSGGSCGAALGRPASAVDCIMSEGREKRGSQVRIRIARHRATR